MKNYDLNLEFCDINILPPIQECLCSLLTSDLTWVMPEYVTKMVSVQYNPTSQILKIVHHTLSLKATDFSFYSYIPSSAIVPLQIAVATLAARHYHLTFISKHGVFKPIIKSKDLNAQPNHAYIQYDEFANYQLTIKNPSELHLINNEYQLICNNEGKETTILVYPVNKKDYEFLQNHYSFLKPCKEVFLAGKDKILVPGKENDGGVFFEGRLFENQLFEWTKELLYDYEVSLDDLDSLDQATPTKERTYQVIWYVLDNLKDLDKNKLFPAFLMHPHCAEWKDTHIQELVAKYLTIAFPYQYVLYNQEESPSDYVALAQANNKTLIPLNINAYHSLASLDQNIARWAHNFLAKKYANNYLNGNLSLNEQNNLNILNKFVNYFATVYLPLRQWMNNHQINYIKFLVVDDYINHIGTLLSEWNVAIIDCTNLKTIANALTAGCEIIKQFESTNNHDAFKTAWLKAAIEFLSKFNVN